MNNTVLFIFAGLLWLVLGFGLGLVFPMFRAQRRLGAVEDAVRSRRATAQDREIEVSPAMRLFVTDANGGSHVTFVEDSGGAAVQVLADRAVKDLAYWWRGPTVAGADSPRRSHIELIRASPRRRVPPPPPVPTVRPPTPEDEPA